MSEIARPGSPTGVGLVLKVALFATGCAGIVAEFVLSTLATYLLGNPIVQWTLIMSLMLFAMGLGSRLSRLIRRDLLDAFILIEFALSILCALSAALAYGLAAHTGYIGAILYGQALVIGVLIGLEIPLVIRINQKYEDLRVNISGVLEKDYLGALVGGLVFAFFALPRLGLTYTPIALGAINFGVAGLLLWRFFPLTERRRTLAALFFLCLLLLAALTVLAEPVIRYGEQKKYRDKVIYSAQTAYQKIVVTRWRQFYWLFINGQEQFSTYDEEKYHEPLVHPALLLAPRREQVLILGGGDGLALREVLAHPDVGRVTLVDLDPAMTKLAMTHPTLARINRGALVDPRVTVVHRDAARFLEKSPQLFDAVIVDLPDPDTVDLMHVYSLGFYRSIHRHLTRGGVVVTQATSPYFSRRAFLCILKTLRQAGFAALPYHNQVPTMGEWGWVLGVAGGEGEEPRLRRRAADLDFSALPTRFLNRDAMTAMIHFGKGILDTGEMDELRVNTELEPVLYRYYLAGSWGMY